MREIDENEKIKLKVKIIEALYSGLGKQASAEAVGINPLTLYNWIAKDPVFASEVMKARASFAKELIPKAIEKEPYKMLRSMYPTDYCEDPQLQINIDNRQLVSHPSSKLLELLEDDHGQRQNPDQK